MSPTIANAPLGEDSSIDESEKIPVSGSKWMSLATIVEYLRTKVQTLENKTMSGSSNTFTSLPAANLLIASQAQGDVLYASSATVWARLGPGTAGQHLETGGAAANPSWADPPYTIPIFCATFNPADATTYYMGAFALAPTTTATSRWLTIPRAGTITRIDIIIFNNGGTQGTNETSTISLRLNNTTDTTITSSFDANDAAGLVSLFNNTALSIAVAEGDHIEIKWVTPTWSTNPTNVAMDIRVYVS